MIRFAWLALFLDAADVETVLGRLAAQPLQIAVFSRAQEPLRAAGQRGCQANLVQEPFHWMRRSEALARALFYGGGGAVTANWLLALLAPPALTSWLRTLNQPLVYLLVSGLPALALGLAIGFAVGRRRGLSAAEAQRLQARLLEGYTLVSVRGWRWQEMTARDALLSAGAGYVARLHGSLVIHRGRAAPTHDEFIVERTTVMPPTEDQPAAAPDHKPS